ncbi:MAG: translation initiation factor IF-2, partial [Rhodospirillales bacterium]|nr:translation initiation factor IF-2 [Rhodospirillales bacterium]
MTETTKDKKTDKEADKKKPLSISRPGKLELKKTVEQGQIKQSFSHGRTKAVTVEVRKKRTYAPNAGGTMAEVKSQGNPLAAGQDVPAGDEHLTSQEKVVRAKALEGAIIDEERRSREEAARLKEEKKKKAEAAEAKPESKAEAAPDIAALESLAPAEGETARAPRKGKAEAAPRAEVGRVEEEEKAGKKGAKADKGRPALTLRKEDDPRRRGKLTIAKALDDESGERVRSLASVRRARERERRAQAGQARGEAVKIIREVVVPETITVQELSNRM